MRFSRHLFYCCLAWVLAVAVGRLPAAEAPPWAHELSEIKPDARVVWGKLENGLRYAILPNANPKDRVHLQLYVQAGSIHEREDERGLAHFVEHMAFKGTTHFKKNELIEYTQRHGMAFGGDTNAETLLSFTRYKLSLARNEPADWKSGLEILRDWAGGLILDPTELEGERGVIESERQARNDGWSRVASQRLDREWEGTPFARRHPIGVPEVIRNAAPEKLRAFYDAWYRPERMVVLIVGDIEVERVEPVVREMFADLAPRSPARAEPVFTSPARTGVVALAFGDPELSSGSISRLSTGAKIDLAADTAERRREMLRRSLAFSILQRRLMAVASGRGNGFSGPVVSVEDQWPMTMVSLEARGTLGRWNENIAELEQHLRSALQYGFAEGEVRLAAASQRATAERSAAAWSNLPSEQLIEALFDSIQRRRVFSNPVDRLSATQEFFNAVTAAECTEALRAVWAGDSRLVGVVSRGWDSGKEQAIRDAYEKSGRQPVRAPADASVPAFAYSDFGPPGKIEVREYDAGLDFHRVVFANGVRLNIKRTEFRKESVEVAVQFGGGAGAQSPDAPGLARYFGAWVRGGLLKHPPGEIEDLNRARPLSDFSDTDQESFQRRFITPKGDLRYTLEFATAFFSEPAFDANEWRKVWSESLGERDSKSHSLAGMVDLQILPALANGDKRLAVPGSIRSFFYRRSTFVNWLRPILEKSPIEIAVVGDVDPARVVEEVARTFGTLPERRRERSEIDGAPWRPTPKPVHRVISYSSAAPRSLVMLAWQATDSLAWEERQKVLVLAEILGDRVRKKIRGEMGFTYSPETSVMIFEYSPAFAYLFCRLETQPERVRQVRTAVEDIARVIAEQGITPEEFERARAPMIETSSSARVTNGYWISLLAEAQLNPARLQWSRQSLDRLRALKKTDLDAAAKNYLRADRLSTFIVEPKNAVSGGQGAAR